MKSKKIRIIIFFFTIFVAISLAWYSQTKEILTLIINGETAFYDNPNWVAGKAIPIIVAKKGDKFPVIECLDTKSDILIKVDFDGKYGFVADGLFLIERRKASFSEVWSSKYAISSCNGMFEKRSKYN